MVVLAVVEDDELGSEPAHAGLTVLPVQSAPQILSRLGRKNLLL